MAVVDIFTSLAMVLFGFLSLLFAALKWPELSALALIICYYFVVFHIGQTVGEDRGSYRSVLSTFFAVLTVTIASFAITYYRYGLMHDGAQVEITVLEALYFSATTWTTLGYGDFAPIPRVRHITSIEAVLGYLGLGLWISLISNFIRNMAENRQRVREHNEKLMKNISNADDENA